MLVYRVDLSNKTGPVIIPIKEMPKYRYELLWGWRWSEFSWRARVKGVYSISVFILEDRVCGASCIPSNPHRCRGTSDNSLGGGGHLIRDSFPQLQIATNIAWIMHIAVCMKRENKNRRSSWNASRKSLVSLSFSPKSNDSSVFGCLHEVDAWSTPLTELRVYN